MFLLNKEKNISQFRNERCQLSRLLKGSLFTEPGDVSSFSPKYAPWFSPAKTRPKYLHAILKTTGANDVHNNMSIVLADAARGHRKPLPG
jgi:hypothetical protein